MLALSDSPRIIPTLELKNPILQADSELYTEIPDEGVLDYEKTFHPPPREDVYILAEEIHVLRQNPITPSTDFTTFRLKPRRHIDVSTGPNIYPLIASLPFVDEILAVEFSPANIRRLCKLIGKDYTLISHENKNGTGGKLHDNPEPLPEYWQDRLYVAALLYDKGGAEGLDNMAAADREYLFDTIQKYCDGTFTKAEKEELVIRLKAEQPDNPYLRITDLQEALREKVSIIRGDIINRPHANEYISHSKNDAVSRKFHAKLEMDELKPYIEMYKRTDPI